MSKIIHNKLPFDINGNILIPLDEAFKNHTFIKEALGDDYIVITSPTELKVIDGDAKIIAINCKKYSYKELMDIIDKASYYDALCR